MGGAVRVIVRKKTGEVKSMIRWTNALPRTVLNIKFFTDESWIDSYINDSKIDTYYSDEYQELSPDGYGIVVLDFMKKKLLSSQTYCHFGSFIISAITREIEDVRGFSEAGYLDIRKTGIGLVDISVDELANLPKYGIYEYSASINYQKLGWELYEYDDTGYNYMNVFKHMYVDGFEFSENDLVEFQSAISGMDNDEEEITETVLSIVRNGKLKKVLG
jgi:hypothetical protein